MPEQRVFVMHGTLTPVQRIGVHLLRGTGIEVKQVGKSELGDFDSTDPFELLRRVDDWAEKKGGRAYPTFHSTGESFSQRHEIVYLDARVVQRFDAPIKNLWPEPFEPHQVGHLFRVVNDHCSRNGFVTGFPNGHWSGEGPERVVQIVAIQKGRAIYVHADIPSLGAHPEEDLPARFRAAHQWAVAHGYTSGIANFHARDWNRPWGERNSLTRCEQDLNQMLQHEGWRVVRVDPIPLSGEGAALAYLLERENPGS